MTVFNDLSAITGVDSNGNASGSYVVDFTASANPQDYWEYDPAEGTLHDRFPANMFTNDQIYWIERFRVQQSGSFINIHNGGSQVQTSFFESTWTDDWAWYFYSVDSDQYLVLQANDQNGAGGSFITYTMSNWTIVAQSTGTQTSTEWLNDLAGERMVVALVPTNTYRPGEAATIKINATETTGVLESLALRLDYEVSLADQTGVAESLVVALNHQLALSDATAAAESIELTEEPIVTSETSQAFESLAIDFDIVLRLEEQTAVTETMSARLPVPPAYQQGIELDDLTGSVGEVARLLITVGGRAQNYWWDNQDPDAPRGLSEGNAAIRDTGLTLNSLQWTEASNQLRMTSEESGLAAFFARRTGLSLFILTPDGLVEVLSDYLASGTGDQQDWRIPGSEEEKLDILNALTDQRRFLLVVGPKGRIFDARGLRIFERQLEHLLPDGEAWILSVNKTIEHYFSALATLGRDARDRMAQVFLDQFPMRTTRLAQWEREFALSSLGTEDERRQVLDATWKATGGQSPHYLQSTLQSAGFDVYVHEWWDLPLPANGIPVARDPTAVLVDSLPLVIAQDGDLIETEDGDMLAQDGRSNEPSEVGYLLVNGEAPRPLNRLNVSATEVARLLIEIGGRAQNDWWDASNPAMIIGNFLGNDPRIQDDPEFNLNEVSYVETTRRLSLTISSGDLGEYFMENDTLSVFILVGERIIEMTNAMAMTVGFAGGATQQWELPAANTDDVTALAGLADGDTVLLVISTTGSIHLADRVPTDSDQWPHIIYIGAETYPELASVLNSRRAELERLCLKLRPAEKWLGMLVKYA